MNDYTEVPTCPKCGTPATKVDAEGVTVYAFRDCPATCERRQTAEARHKRVRDRLKEVWG